MMFIILNPFTPSNRLLYSAAAMSQEDERTAGSRYPGSDKSKPVISMGNKHPLTGFLGYLEY
jgi:hypothetical protein